MKTWVTMQGQPDFQDPCYHLDVKRDVNLSREEGLMMDDEKPIYGSIIRITAGFNLFECLTWKTMHEREEMSSRLE